MNCQLHLDLSYSAAKELVRMCVKMKRTAIYHGVSYFYQDGLIQQLLKELKFSPFNKYQTSKIKQKIKVYEAIG